MKTAHLARIALAIALVLALLDMPYGYYTLLRFVVAVAALCEAARYYDEDNSRTAIIAIAVAILFQPIFKVHLGRTLWNILDVILAIVVLLPVFTRPKEHENTQN